MKRSIGFMQGRLSPLINGRIQIFPWLYWREEFTIAEHYSFRLMEWTLDQDRLYENPLLTSAGQREIRKLSQSHGIIIASLTGDCFMQAPFWKSQGVERETLQRDFLAVAEACASVGISIIVVPLVDNGRIESTEQEDALIDFLKRQTMFLSENSLQVVFESDFDPTEMSRFIERLDPIVFGINYDIGNSAALGFSPAEELAAYGHRITNVHVKDRKLGGITVSLGSGNADFETVFASLAKIGYSGNFILQTARAADDDHTGVLCRYRDMTAKWLSSYGS